MNESYFKLYLLNTQSAKLIIFVSMFFFVTNVCFAKVIEYRLSSDSEEYNVNYFFCSSINDDLRDSLSLYNYPSSFIVEINSLGKDEKFTICYNKLDSFSIIPQNEKYLLGQKSLFKTNNDGGVISLYFVNNRILLYQGGKLIGKRRFVLNPGKPIVFKWNKESRFDSGHFINCYEPIPFRRFDYGGVLDNGLFFGYSPFKIISENIGTDYCLKTSNNYRCNSSSSLRFEYNYNDSQNISYNTNRRARSEISGVYSKSPMSKWIIEFDIFIPDSTKDDEDDFEIITQIHEGCKISTTPSFFLYMLNGFLSYSLRGDDVLIEKWNSKMSPKYVYNDKICYLSKEKWHHIKVYLKEGWRYECSPLTKVWVDDNLVFVSKVPNCYCYTPAKSGYYNFIKFGIYKPGWLGKSICKKEISKRVYYFDNYLVLN